MERWWKKMKFMGFNHLCASYFLTIFPWDPSFSVPGCAPSCSAQRGPSGAQGAPGGGAMPQGSGQRGRWRALDEPCRFPGGPMPGWFLSRKIPRSFPQALKTAWQHELLVLEVKSGKIPRRMRIGGTWLWKAPPGMIWDFSRMNKLNMGL